jgi:hypothetical protein
MSEQDVKAGDMDEAEEILDEVREVPEYGS